MRFRATSTIGRLASHSRGFQASVRCTTCMCGPWRLAAAHCPRTFWWKRWVNGPLSSRVLARCCAMTSTSNTSPCSPSGWVETVHAARCLSGQCL